LCWFLDAGNNKTLRTLKEPAFCRRRQLTRARDCTWMES
jgi:hypothetical protein